ncbi:MAG: response regulator, partial [Isosphaeraceae bacterium]
MNQNELQSIPRILIADDNVQNVELLEAYLGGFECEIRTAQDGEETLRLVQEFRPDLLLLDIMMPRLSGFEVCRMLRANPQTKDLLILMVTALNEPADFERGV